MENVLGCRTSGELIGGDERSEAVILGLRVLLVSPLSAEHRLWFVAETVIWRQIEGYDKARR